jgi:hypothetical protein
VDLPEPRDLLEGEDALWGEGIIWDGYGRQNRAMEMVADGTVGDLDGSGIIWDGCSADRGQLWYVGARVSGAQLLDPAAWPSDPLWGEGIIWDGVVGTKTGPVWSQPSTWSGSLVWPDRLEAAGLVAPLFELPSLTGLTEPVPGACDPMPFEPAFQVGG